MGAGLAAGDGPLSSQGCALGGSPQGCKTGVLVTRAICPRILHGLVQHLVEHDTPAPRRPRADFSAIGDGDRRAPARDHPFPGDPREIPQFSARTPSSLTFAPFTARSAAQTSSAPPSTAAVIALPDGRGALMVGDGVGHGARAAGAMGQLRAVLSNAFAEGHEPADALRRVNRFAA